MIAVLVLGFLFLGFLTLTYVERKRGARFFRGFRARLDVETRAAADLARDVELVRSLFGKLVALVSAVVHEVVHGMLLGIRALERVLTRTARKLREKAVTEDVQ